MNSLNYPSMVKIMVTHSVAMAIGYYWGKNSKCNRT